MSGRRSVTIHYDRPPGRVELFHQEVVLEDGSSVVWFTFPGAWHDIGRFHRADGTFTGFYANVLTPVEMDGDDWWTTDLFLDVWLPPDGAPVILDEAELDEAVGRELVERTVAERARLEAEGLQAAAEAGSWPPAVVREWTLERARS